MSAEQTQLDYNELMFGQNGEPFRYKEVTIVTQNDPVIMPKGTVLTPTGTGSTYDPPADATATDGWSVLLEDTDTTGGSVAAKIGTSGGVYEDKLNFEGTLATFTEQVKRKFASNNIYVIKGTNSMAIAGEGV